MMIHPASTWQGGAELEWQARSVNPLFSACGAAGGGAGRTLEKKIREPAHSREPLGSDLYKLPFDMFVDLGCSLPVPICKS